MDFTQVLLKIKRRISNAPVKLPGVQISQRLKECNDIAGVNELLRYCIYDEEDDSSKNLENWKPSPVMASVMLKRLVITLLTLSSTSSSLQLSHKDRMQITASLQFLRPVALKSPALAWRLLFVLQVLAKEANVTYLVENDFFQGILEQEQDALSKKARVEYTAEKGRHVVASRDIRAGEVISCDLHPLAIIFFDPMEGKEVDVVCVQCGKSSLASFPCPTCPDVLFCSLACMNEARRSHHQFECPMRLYAILKATSMGMASASVGRILPLRIATLHPGCSFPAAGNVKQHAHFPTPHHQLMALSCSPQESDHSFNMALLELLRSTPNYPLMDEKGLLDLMSYWGQLVNANSFAVEVAVLRRGRKCLPGKMEVAKRQIGTAVYGPSSYFNHSCNPNVTFIVGGKANVMVATRGVRAGQELCISYGPTFAFNGGEGRLTELEQSYGFKCQCQACLEQWPLMASLPQSVPPHVETAMTHLKRAEVMLHTHDLAERRALLNDNDCGPRGLLQGIWSARDEALSQLPPHHVCWVDSRARLSFWLFSLGSRW